MCSMPSTKAWAPLAQKPTLYIRIDYHFVFSKELIRNYFSIETLKKKCVVNYFPKNCHLQMMMIKGILEATTTKENTLIIIITCRSS